MYVFSLFLVAFFPVPREVCCGLTHIHIFLSGNDTVTMQGFTVKDQGMGVMDQLSANVLTGTLSGLMGLGWPRLAQSGATPWWQAVINAGSWTDPLFGFYLARFVDDPTAQTVETKGGSMDLGFANTEFYEGDINYVPLTSETYWLIPLDGLNINGNKLNPGGDAAIDTCVFVFMLSWILSRK